MSPLARISLGLISLLIFGFVAFYLYLVAHDPNNYQEPFDQTPAPAVALLNSSQVRSLTLGRQVAVRPYEVSPITNNVEFDHTRFDFDVQEQSIEMTFNLNPGRTRLQPNGNLEAGTFDRYYLRFKGVTIIQATADPTAPLVPRVVWDGRTLLIEISEGMQLGPGQNARILLETADSAQLSPTTTPVATLETLFIPAESGE